MSMCISFSMCISKHKLFQTLRLIVLGEKWIKYDTTKNVTKLQNKMFRRFQKYSGTTGGQTDKGETKDGWTDKERTDNGFKGFRYRLKRWAKDSLQPI